MIVDQGEVWFESRRQQYVDSNDWQLYERLLTAYFDARRHKRSTNNQLAFEIDLLHHVQELYDAIHDRHYTLEPGIAFVVDDPKPREILAASFRDRVVHHFVCSLMTPYWEPRFIADSYSCRVGKGTHYAIARAHKHAQRLTHNYRDDAWVLKLDLKCYFMYIDKAVLWELIQPMFTADEDALAAGRISEEEARYHLVRGFNDYFAAVLEYLLRIIIFSCPMLSVQLRGRLDRWTLLPAEKTLFIAPFWRGFPIGNLTSQLFSNIYLHALDCYIKYRLGFTHYGRYVDDLYLMDTDKTRLKRARTAIGKFLADTLHLRLHPTKVILQPVKYGFPFVGGVVRPHSCVPTRRFQKRYQKFMTGHSARHYTQYQRARIASYQGHDTKICHLPEPKRTLAQKRLKRLADQQQACIYHR